MWLKNNHYDPFLPLPPFFPTPFFLRSMIFLAAIALGLLNDTDDI